MKITLDLPETLLQRARAAAAQHGRPLDQLVADAVEVKLAEDEAAVRAAEASENALAAFAAGLQRLPDGSLFNVNGIDDEGSFETLDALRAGRRA